MKFLPMHLPAETEETNKDQAGLLENGTLVEPKISRRENRFTSQQPSIFY
jgi:hypothetical protein